MALLRESGGFSKTVNVAFVACSEYGTFSVLYGSLTKIELEKWRKKKGKKVPETEYSSFEVASISNKNNKSASTPKLFPSGFEPSEWIYFFEESDGKFVVDSEGSEEIPIVEEDDGSFDLGEDEEEGEEEGDLEEEDYEEDSEEAEFTDGMCLYDESDDLEVKVLEEDLEEGDEEEDLEEEEEDLEEEYPEEEE